ncbi:MAG: DUF84 family protein [bacterium]
MLVAVGSKSGINKDSVVAALESLKIPFSLICIDTGSIVNNQPSSIGEGVRGAIYRALICLFDNPDVEVAIGIENFIYRHSGGAWIDRAAVCVIHRRDMVTVTQFSNDVLVPDWAIENVIRSGFQNTVGQVMAERFEECEPDDPQSFLTSGKHSRRSLLTGTIAAALSALLAVID